MIVLTLDWTETDKGQGVFRCGAETHKNTNYQELIHCSFFKSVIDFIDDTDLQHDLRVRIDRILTLSVKRNKIANDVELDPVMKEGMLFALEYEIRSQTNDLPDLQGLIETHIPGKAMRALVFLLHKASEVMRLFNKQKSGFRARESVKISKNLNPFPGPRARLLLIEQPCRLRRLL